MSSYTDTERHAIAEAGKFDADDILAFGPHYFSCGWKKETYYNFNYAVAIALVGKLYGDRESKNSDYHKGVEYIADAVGVSKRQVKILRKKVKGKHGYWFKTPYTTAKIIQEVIDKLREQEGEASVRTFLKKSESEVYREILIAEQYGAIKAACKGNRAKVISLANDLRYITVKVGDIE